MDKAGRLLAEARKIIRQRGIAGTVGRLLTEPLFRYRDWRFDRKYGVQTSGIVSIPDLDINETDRRGAERYQPVRLHAFAEFMRVLNIRHDEFTFVDFGCGKGRALFLASAFPFRRIVGVELSPALSRIAVNNIHTYRSATQRCHAIEVVCQNALAFELPREPLVLYFYNPFGHDVMSRILGNLRESLRTHPRRVFVVLYNPVLEGLVRGVDFLQLYTSTGRCSIYESARGWSHSGGA